MMRVNFLFALLLGAIGTLAFSPFDFWPAGLISLFGLLWLPLNKTIKQSAWLGFCWGMGLFLSGISWVYVSIQQFGGASPIAAMLLVVLLASYLSLYPLLFNLLLSRFWPKTNYIRLAIAAPACWQITEFLRGWVMTGFPWLQFGYSQINGPLKSLAPIVGVSTINLLLIAIVGLAVLAIKQRKIAPAIYAIGLLLFPLLLSHIQWTTIDTQRKVNVALVQGNIEQSIKWDPDHLQNTLNTYVHLTKPYIGQADIIIWPEAAIADLEIYQTDFLTQLDQEAREHNSTLLTGIINYNQHQQYYNSLVILGDQERYQYPTTNRYNKYHLVPFGEFIPLAYLFEPIARILNFPMSSMDQGDYLQQPLLIKNYRVTAAICYEIILGEQIRDNFTPDTDFLLTISNDTWFGRSIGPWQHLQMARMRALELGRPLIRSTNNGITAIIDIEGNVVTQLPQFEAAVLSTSFNPATGMTPYAQFGSWPYWFLTLLMALFALLRRPMARILH